MFLNKRAQIGETITWIFATVIIISILGITFFVAEISLGKNKDIKQTTQVDILVSKSFFSYLLTVGETGENVYEEIDIEGSLNEVNGPLGRKIFDLYKKDYFLIWMGLGSRENNYFGQSPFKQIGTAASGRQDPFLTSSVILSEQANFYNQGNITKSLNLLFFKK